MGRTIGFIGLGNMGGPMAANLQKLCDRFLINDHHQEHMDPLIAKGAEVELDVVRMAVQSDVVVLSLPGPRQVQETLLGEKGLLENGRPGMYIVDTSTIDVQTSQKMAERAAERQIFYVDAPVSGGPKKAASSTLTVMVGAREEELTEIADIMKGIGSNLFYMGVRGGGSAIKIINNCMSFSIGIVNAEALKMADHVGIDFDTFYAVVKNSSGGNTTLNVKSEKLRNNDIEAAFTIDLVIKDLELASQLCRDCGISNFSLAQALQWYRMAQHCGYAKKDSTAVARMIRGLESESRGH